MSARALYKVHVYFARERECEIERERKRNKEERA